MEVKSWHHLTFLGFLRLKAVTCLSSSVFSSSTTIGASISLLGNTINPTSVRAAQRVRNFRPLKSCSIYSDSCFFFNEDNLNNFINTLRQDKCGDLKHVTYILFSVIQQPYMSKSPLDHFALMGDASYHIRKVNNILY